MDRQLQVGTAMRTHSTSILAVCGLAAVCWAATPALATEINFDDLPPGSYGFTWVPLNYSGFTWSSPFCGGTPCQAWGLVGQDAFNNGNPSPVTFPSYPNAAYNSGGVQEVTMTSSSLEVFQSAEFMGWTTGSTSVTVKGYAGGTLEWTVSENISYGNFTTLDFGSAPVDTVAFFNVGAPQQWWLVDNIEYAAPPAETPVPPSLALFATGLVGLGGLSALRRRRAA